MFRSTMSCQRPTSEGARSTLQRPKWPSSASRSPTPATASSATSCVSEAPSTSATPPDAKATSALLVEAFGDIGLERSPAVTPPGSRSPATSWSRSARRRCAPTARCCRSKAYPAQDDLLAVLQQLARSGYTIALDELRRPHRHRGADVALLDRQGRRRPIAARRAARGDPARRSIQGALLVATGVERPRGFERCRALGFTYFQGEYFAKPRAVQHRGVATAGLGSLRRLGELTSGDVSFEDLERIISSDVGLSLKLLRYVNSAFFALPRTVSSVREALSPARRPHRPPLGDGHGDLRDPGRAGRARRARPAPRPHVRDARRQRAARGARDALHDRPVLGRRRAAGRADGRRARLAARSPRDPGRAAAPRGSQGRAARRRHRLRARRVPDADRRPTPAPSLAGAYRAALEWADEAGRAIA